MREILFRGKHTDNGEWVEGFYVHANKYYEDLADSHFIVEHGEFEYDNYARYEVDPTTVSQFSGLCDKNGKRIFEGDIVQIEDYTHGCALNYKQPTSKWVVHWREDIARFCIDYMPLLPFDFTESEIVGNIHDNPELLEVSHE